MAEETVKKRPGGPVKVFIVQCLARFMSPTEVSKLVNQDFGLDTTRQSVEAYDPTKFLGRKLSKKLTEIFWDTRKSFLLGTGLENIALAHQNVRLRELTELYWRAKAKGNDMAAAQFLIMSAKERGGLYTNKRELKVDDKRKTLADMLGVQPEELPTERVM